MRAGLVAVLPSQDRRQQTIDAAEAVVAGAELDDVEQPLGLRLERSPLQGQRTDRPGGGHENTSLGNREELRDAAGGEVTPCADRPFARLAEIRMGTILDQG